jgi:Asp-tRNA(Asn)/Glu-tRNA(Gln) amidotransferase C subunit
MSEEESIEGPSDSFEHLTTPTWSVHELLSTYPAPKLEPELLTRLHKMSALKAPAEDSDAFNTLKGEMEELIRLVEAVKLVDTTGVPSDGRIWPIGRGIDLDSARAKNEVSTGEQDILRHATKTFNGYYVVDTPPSGRRK